MFRDVTEKEVKYLVGLIAGDGIVTAEKAKLIRRLEGESYERELVNISATVYRDQKEFCDSTENASQCIRLALDEYMKMKGVPINGIIS